MVDPRIYRAGWVIVFIALIVFGFSLRSRPPGASTNLAPGVSFAPTEATARSLAERFGAPTPGSAADARLAGVIATGLRRAGGFSVSTQTAPLVTVDGERAVTTVEAERAGLGQGTIVVVANRDEVTGTPAAHARASGTLAGTAASAVLLGLAQEFAGATLNRSLLLISTAGAAGGAGDAELAQTLAGTGVTAVLDLGDLAGARVRGPVIVPWSNSDLLAPPTLTETLADYVHAQTGIGNGLPSFGSELAQLAFPLTAGGQAAFTGAGMAAVGLSLSGDRLAQRAEAVDPARIPALGLALDQTINALEAAPAPAPPSSYLTLSSQIVPLWAIRLLVLALIAPVALTLVDALARARRRGHSILSWSVWVLSGIAPWIAGLVLLRAAGLLGVLPALAQATDGGSVLLWPGLAAAVAALLVTAVAFRVLRPLGVQIASGIGWRRTPNSPAIEGASVGLSVVLCALVLLEWLINPFTAALFVPALHLWLWIGSPAVAGTRLRSGALVLAGLLIPGLVVVHAMLALSLAPWGLLASVSLALAGPSLGLEVGLVWGVALGVLSGVLVLVLRAARASSLAAAAPVTVRGPGSYAGPGSLGGTQSALRR